MASTILTTAESNSVICAVCKLYLSIGPIYINSNLEPVCGRCNIPPNNKKYRAIFYEKIAKLTLFPCRNDEFGCDAILPWASVQTHEEICKFQPLKCPVLNCNNNIELKNIQNHFTQSHPEFIMNANEFKLSCSNNNNTTDRLYIWQNKKFLVRISYYEQACYFSIESFAEINEMLFYDLLLSDGQNSDKIHIRQEVIGIYQNRNCDHIKMKKIDYNSVSKLLGKDIFCRFTITRKESSRVDPLNLRLLLNLECPVCFNYMKPPIYMCDNGHCICEKCNTKMTLCPSCREQLKHSRNFTLEKISEDVLYPCKYTTDGCNFHGKTGELAIHEKSCYTFASLSKKYSCVIKLQQPCSWAGDIKQFSEHMKSQHGNHFITLGIAHKLKWCRSAQTVCFTAYDGEIFRITFEYGNVVGFRIKIVDISNNKKCDYKFILNFTKNDNNFLIVSKKCEENSLDINKSLVKPFIVNDSICFKINIIEKFQC